MLRLILILVFLSSCEDPSSSVQSENQSPYATRNGTRSAEIKIDLDSSGKRGRIDREFYGTQIAPFTPYPPSSAVRPLQLGTIRIGGNLYDRYNWENNMTYLSERNYVELDPYDEIIRKVRDYGAEPIMQINLMGQRPEYMRRRLTMRNSADAQSAGQFIRNANGRKRLGLKHVCLGNEFAQWPDTHSELWPGHEPLTADQYIDRFIDFALSIRKAQEEVSGDANDIKIWGPEISISYADWQSGNMETDCEWTSVRGVIECSYGNGEFDHFMPYFFKRLKDAENDQDRNPNGYKILDYASFHYYPNFRTRIDDVNTVIVDSEGHQMVNEILESTRVLHDESYTNLHDRSSYMNFIPNIFGRMKKWRDENYPDAELSLSEFAVDSYDTSNHYHEIIRPIYMADTVGLAATNGIKNINRSFLNSNSPQPLPWKLLLDDQPTNLYDLFIMYSNYYKGDLLDVSDSFGDKLNAYGALNTEEGSGDINIFVVNKSARETRADVRYIQKGREVKKISHEFSPWSVTMIRLRKDDLSNAQEEIVEYGAREMGIYIDPHYY